MKKQEYPYRHDNRKDADTRLTDDWVSRMDAQRMSEEEGSVRGVVGNSETLLKEHKNNSNPSQIPFEINVEERTQAMETRAALIRDVRLQRALNGDQLSFEFHPPPPITLAELRIWCAIHSNDDWRNADGDRWTAPDCTVGVLRYHANGKIAGFVPCGSWDCPVCSAAKKKKLIDNTLRVFGDVQCFHITMTVDPNKFDDKQITIAFNRAKSYLAKHGYFQPKKGHFYLWVKEFTPPSHEYLDQWGHIRKSIGYVRHLHVQTNFYVPPALLRTAWMNATGGTSYQIKITSETATHGAVRASYITKYITKGCTGEMPEHDFQRFERRFGKSIRLFTMKPRSKGLCFMQPIASPFPEMNIEEFTRQQRARRAG